MDYCGAGPYYASGGFIADSEFTGMFVTTMEYRQPVARSKAVRCPRDTDQRRAPNRPSRE